ncbi:hypothetical protein [Nonomuraea typhae]|uniref:hypothetical protein n=1 Tax=Nonomuraea typhae TaxID=2603600 RepID=UPI0012F93226|nr:hypothetical protein [Nonomuraea typhae]
MTEPAWHTRPWRELPDRPHCPQCHTGDTRWDAISADYEGCWWECRHDHRFLLDLDGTPWRTSDLDRLTTTTQQGTAPSRQTEAVPCALASCNEHEVTTS